MCQRLQNCLYLVVLMVWVLVTFYHQSHQFLYWKLFKAIVIHEEFLKQYFQLNLITVWRHAIMIESLWRHPWKHILLFNVQVKRWKHMKKNCISIEITKTTFLRKTGTIVASFKNEWTFFFSLNCILSEKFEDLVLLIKKKRCYVNRSVVNWKSSFRII